MQTTSPAGSQEMANFRKMFSRHGTASFPKESGVGIIYQEGIVFGGFVRDGLFGSAASHGEHLF